MNERITNKVCRACLAKEDFFNYYIFDNVAPEMYSFCTSLEVEVSDGLPKSLCSTCYKMLVKLAEFKRICLDSHKSLLISLLKTEILKEKAIEIETDIKLKTEIVEEKATEIETDIKLKTEIVEEKASGIETDIKYIRTFDKDSLFQNEQINCKVDSDILQQSENTDDSTLDTEMYNVKAVRKLKKQSKKSRPTKRKQIRIKVDTNIEMSKRSFNFTCDICSKKFVFLERFENHKLIHEGKDYSISCKVCKKIFKTWNGLNRHRETEHSVVHLDTLKCATCGKIFKSRQTLKVHQLTHAERTLTICDICGKIFKSTMILKIHMETHKQNRERQHPCEHCGKKFFTGTTLSTHVARRHTGRRYVCHLCCSSFSDKFSLGKHLLAHQGVKPHKCDICDRSYSSQSFLAEHKRMHSGDKPFACDTCPKRFISKKRLRDHLRTHTGEKPYKCSLCTHAFTQRGTLKRHMRVHDKFVLGV